MKIAILGASSGTHFLSKKILESPAVDTLYHIGANIALQPTGRYLPINDISYKSVIKFLEETNLDFIILNTIDFLRNKKIQEKIQELGIPTCSPSYELSKLEWSKIDGKKLLHTLKIPTPSAETINFSELLLKFKTIKRPYVIKFEEDWRAGLQTLIITDENVNEEYTYFSKYGNKRFSKQFGDFLDQKLSIEEFVQIKKEYSYHAICNEKNWTYLGSARDYKKFGENDTGFNTDGMGSRSPIEINPVVHDYMDRIYNELKEKGTPYKGIIYLGIAEDHKGNIYVLEINTRPGDPEFQSIVLTHDTNIVNILQQVAMNEKINDIKFNGRNAVSVRIVNSQYRKLIDMMSDNEIHKLEPQINPNLWPELPNRCISYHRERKLLNSVIASTGNTKEEASDNIYNFLKNINMYSYTFRKDIGYLE